MKTDFYDLLVLEGLVEREIHREGLKMWLQTPKRRRETEYRIEYLRKLYAKLCDMERGGG